MSTLLLQNSATPDDRSINEVGHLSVHRHVMHRGAHLRRDYRSNAIRVGMIVSDAPALTFRGNPLVGDELAVSGADALDLYALGTSTLIWIDVDRSLIDSAIDEKIMNFSTGTVRPDSNALRDLRTACMTLLATSGATAEEAAALRLIRQLEKVLRDASVRAYTKESKRRYDLVRRAEEYMWEHVEGPIDPASIAGAFDCSIRKLLYYFKRTYGLGPIGYFKIQRLNAVREALATDRARRTIADIAADYGFWHMGHFGSAYRELFGVTPSQTHALALEHDEVFAEIRGGRSGRVANLQERYLQPVRFAAFH
jgi:AraC-like DNA-binding protein